MLILTRKVGAVKEGLRVKVSVGKISRDLGCLVRGRILAQARDCRVRESSGGAVGVVSTRIEWDGMGWRRTTYGVRWLGGGSCSQCVRLPLRR